MEYFVCNVNLSLLKKNLLITAHAKMQISQVDSSGQ